MFWLSAEKLVETKYICQYDTVIGHTKQNLGEQFCFKKQNDTVLPIFIRNEMKKSDDWPKKY